MLKGPGLKSLGLYIVGSRGASQLGGYVQKYVQQNLHPQYYKTRLFKFLTDIVIKGPTITI